MPAERRAPNEVSALTISSKIEDRIETQEEPSPRGTTKKSPFLNTVRNAYRRMNLKMKPKICNVKFYIQREIKINNRNSRGSFEIRRRA